MQQTLIVAIVLVRDEDIYLENVLANISGFCDRIIIADHLSQDGTSKIAKQFCEKNTKGIYHRIHHPSESHELINKYAGQKVWIFGVDGDELYDPSGLAELRKRLVAGEYDRYWMILGNALNCTEIDFKGKTAAGYLAPPSRSMTKLYNFMAINSWEGDCSERLHGGNIAFNENYNREQIYFLYKEITWEKSFFRCLHLCFLPRSTRDNKGNGDLLMRKNIADTMSENIVQRVKSGLCRYLGMQCPSSLKREKYMRGELIHVDIGAFT